MRFFTCLLHPDGDHISDETRRAYQSLPRARGLAFRWWSSGPAAVLTGWDDHSSGGVPIAEDGHWFAVGVVRLDNRADLERRVGCEGEKLTDLGIVLRAVARHGVRYIPKLLGDFAFLVWDGDTRAAVAACDSLAVEKLYYAERDGIIAFASRAEALALDERYELQYLVELAALLGPPRDLSVFAGVRPVLAGTFAVLEQTRLSFHRYWNAADFDVEPAWANSERDAIETCRLLLAESLRLRLGREGETWSQLSGGLDSSSVVSLIQWLVERGELQHGLAGTVTYVDREGTGADEREYSDAVVSRWRVRNETIVDPPTWHDQHHEPPRTDQPRFDFIFYPRNYRLCATVQGSGGRVLLTGWGGDELFQGNMLYFADWLVQGRVWPAMHEMARRSALGRVSFWELAYRNALLPLLPRALQYRLVRDGCLFPPWLMRPTMRRYRLTPRAPSAHEYTGRLGHKYRHAVATKVAALGRLTTRDVLADFLDVRHPFLYRPLVEFALRLPPELRARPHAHRWVLREAMRGILPDAVRTRVGKPGTGEAMAWALATQRARLLPLLQEPILAQLGVVDGVKLRAEFDAASQRTRANEYLHTHLLSILAVEAWLQMRSGRWPHGGHFGSTGITT